jgi:hypothetical protein
MRCEAAAQGFHRVRKRTKPDTKLPPIYLDKYDFIVASC